MILIPDSLWEMLLDEFGRTIPNVERVAYLDGVRVEDLSVVTTLTIPDADLHTGYYDVPAEAMSQAGRHFRTHQLSRIAQVHTHGNSNCHHSFRDDEKAYSLKDGAVSIVLPFHATGRPETEDGIVHLRRQGFWRPLDRDEASALIRVTPSFLDFRSPKWIVPRADTKATSAGLWSLLKRLFRLR